jgi:hypothetical protein
MNTLKTATDTVTEAGRNALETLEEIGKMPGRKLDEVREETAGALHAAASSVRRTGRRSSAAIDDFATGAAGRLDTAGCFVKDHDLKGVMKTLDRFGRSHLAISLTSAAVLGVLAGSALSRATHRCEKCGCAAK